MKDRLLLDTMVKESLKRWPQRPPGLKPRRGKESWLRGRPSEDTGVSYPFLKLPGSTKLRTVPDGLWLNFGGTFEEPYVDIFAVEACSTIQNLLDKRSRFSPSTHSTLAVCPVAWLLAPVTRVDPTPRWRATAVFRHEPAIPAAIPVRDVRVLFGLKDNHYAGFARHQLPHAHEFFVPMKMLIEEKSENNPRLRELVKRASVSSNFYNLKD
jgi:hypothetical protein